MLTEEQKARLPNFFILGAAKCGTTAMYRTLKQHPQIFMSTLKETYYFSDNRKYGKGLNYYVSKYFPASECYRVRGEASPNYFSRPSKIAPRMLESLDRDALKFVVLLRDPVERAYSHYLHRRKFLAEPLSFSEALDLEEKKGVEGEPRDWPGYYYQGLYGKLTAEWFDYFSPSKFLFIAYEDLVDAWRAVLERLCVHLNVDAKYDWAELMATNQAKTTRSRFLMRQLAKPRPWLRWLNPFIGRDRIRWIRTQIRESNTKPMVKPPIDEEIERRLRERYVGDIMLLEKLIGQDFNRWKPATADTTRFTLLHDLGFKADE